MIHAVCINRRCAGAADRRIRFSYPTRVRSLAAFLLGLYLASADPAVAATTVGTPTPGPGPVTVGHPTQLVVTSQVTSAPGDPAVLPNGVTLVRLDGPQPVVLGVMQDDGMNGDATAGDGLYTIRITLNETSAGQVQLQTSAAIRGVLQRVRSGIAVVNVDDFRSLPSATPTLGAIPLTVTFISNAINSGGAITRWRWDYQGDGTFDVDEVGAQNHTFTFTKTGVYPAVLEVTNDRGLTTTATVTITATNQPVTATARVSPTNGPVPLAVTLTGTGTSPNGTIVKYEWDRLGNGTFDYSSTTTGTTTFTYPQAGTYNSLFRVTDSFGQTATAEATATAIRVGPPGSPTARITSPSGPLTGNTPLARSFSGTGTPTTGRTITKYEWDFNGDGVYDTSSATSGSASFTYLAPGTFTVFFKVTDSVGDSAIDAVVITVKMIATLTVSTDTLRPASGGSVNIQTSIGGTVPVTVFLKDRVGQVIRTLVKNVSRTAGSYTDPWDGKTDAGAVVPEGVYYAILQYTAGGTTVSIDTTSTTGNEIFQPDRTILISNGPMCTTSGTCTINAFTNSFLEADFTLPQAAEVTISIRDFNTGLEVALLFERRLFGRGTPSAAFWDGSDATGKVLKTPANDPYVYGMTAFSLPTNGIFVENGPTLTAVTASPNYFDPSTGDFISPTNPTTKISYTLSKAATVSLQVVRSGTNVVLRTLTQSAAPGAGVIEWDGRAANGIFADAGDYRLALKAVDASGNQSIVRYVAIRVFH